LVGCFLSGYRNLIVKIYPSAVQRWFGGDDMRTCQGDVAPLRIFAVTSTQCVEGYGIHHGAMAITVALVF